MNMRTVRLTAVVIAAVTLLPITVAFVTDQTQTTPTKRVEGVSGSDRGGYTAITTQEFKETYPEAELIVLSPNGSTVHVNTKYSTYFDVDPVPGHPDVVEYVAANHLTGDQCDAADRCTREVFVRENFQTGESSLLWSRISPREHSTRIHDIDRINESRIVVADIYSDQVFIYDLDRGIRVWTWSAQRDFPIGGGGPFPNDWTHVNDVEVLDNGTLMESLRNQDSVVFLSQNGTFLSRKTLGQDGNHDTLYEQHNPDYINGSPPAVIVADSENNRVIEYEWRNNSWNVSWSWQDDRLRWPRDADRLPNGHTLITDSNGNRVFEVNRTGAVVWSVDIGLPYEAERLSTGDESSGGLTASEADLNTHAEERSRSENEQAKRNIGFRTIIFSIFPDSILQAVAFVLPQWLGLWHVPFLGGFVLTITVWGGLEYYHSPWRLRSPISKRE